MAWYVLKNRRHVGPYQDFELVAMHRRQMLSTDDFVISDEDINRNDLVYKRVVDVVHLETDPDDPRAAPLPAKPAHVDEPERPLGSFSDEDLEKSQVSRIFSDAVESVDLIKPKPLPPLPTAPGRRASNAPEVTRAFDTDGESRLTDAPLKVPTGIVEKLSAVWEEKQSTFVMVALVVVLLAGGYSLRGEFGKFFDKAGTTAPNARVAGEANRQPAAQPRAPRPRPASAPPTVRVPEVRAAEPARPAYETPPPPPPPEPIYEEAEEAKVPASSGDPRGRGRARPVPGAPGATGGNDEPYADEDSDPAEVGDEEGGAPSAAPAKKKPAPNGNGDNPASDDYEE